MYNSLGYSIKFEHMTTLNLIVIRKYNIICLLLVNVAIYLNLIKKPKIYHLIL